MAKKRLTRRDFLTMSGMASLGTILAACAAEPEIVEKIVKETVVVEKEVEKLVKETVVVKEEVEVARAVGLKDVPRERTLVMSHLGFAGAWNSAGIHNPYATVATHRLSQGGIACWENGSYYSAFADEEWPWLATSHEWNDDFSEVTVNIRDGVEWSDGVPFTAEDLVFTINMLKEYAPAIRYSADMEKLVKEAVVVDPLTAKITLNGPNPRFYFNYLTYAYMRGIHIVPKHIFENVEDVTTFTNFDPEKGWPVTTGPYTPVVSTYTQVIFERRDNWWAAKTGFAELPKVERIIGIPWAGGETMSQLLIANQLDVCTDLRPAEIVAVLEQNPAIITHTKAPPYGYVCHWTICIGFNALEEPWDNPDIRWAISYAIDRQQAIEVAYGGAGTAAKLPFPDPNTYKGLKECSNAIGDLLQKYDTNEFNPEKSAALMEKNGYVKDSQGFWSKDGERLTFELGGALDLFGDIGPIVGEQLRNAGFDTEYINPPDHWDRIGNGVPTNYVYFTGQLGSIRDPYATLLMYHEDMVQPTGQPGWPNVWRWQNDEFSAIVDEMAMLPIGDPGVVDLFREAMEIWLKELPSLPFIEWIHRIPMNTTYWVGWPTEDDPYVNGAVWQWTLPRIIDRLEPVQPDPREA